MQSASEHCEEDGVSKFRHTNNLWKLVKFFVSFLTTKDKTPRIDGKKTQRESVLLRNYAETWPKAKSKIIFIEFMNLMQSTGLTANELDSMFDRIKLCSKSTYYDRLDREGNFTGFDRQDDEHLGGITALEKEVLQAFWGKPRMGLDFWGEGIGLDLFEEKWFLTINQGRARLDPESKDKYDTSSVWTSEHNLKVTSPFALQAHVQEVLEPQKLMMTFLVNVFEKLGLLPDIGKIVTSKLGKKGTCRLYIVDLYTYLSGLYTYLSSPGQIFSDFVSPFMQAFTTNLLSTMYEQYTGKSEAGISMVAHLKNISSGGSEYYLRKINPSKAIKGPAGKKLRTFIV